MHIIFFFVMKINVSNKGNFPCKYKAYLRVVVVLVFLVV